MDRERWPETVRHVVDQLVCPGCGQHRDEGKGIFAMVAFQAFAWMIRAECMNCHRLWLLKIEPTTELGVTQLQPQPVAAVAEPSTVKKPDWYATIESGQTLEET